MFSCHLTTQLRLCSINILSSNRPPGNVSEHCDCNIILCYGKRVTLYRCFSDLGITRPFALSTKRLVRYRPYVQWVRILRWRYIRLIWLAGSVYICPQNLTLASGSQPNSLTVSWKPTGVETRGVSSLESSSKTWDRFQHEAFSFYPSSDIQRAVQKHLLRTLSWCHHRDTVVSRMRPSLGQQLLLPIRHPAVLTISERDGITTVSQSCHPAVRSLERP